MCKKLKSGTCAAASYLVVYTLEDVRTGRGWFKKTTRTLFFNTRWDSAAGCSSEHECVCCDPSQNSGQLLHMSYGKSIASQIAQIAPQSVQILRNIQI
eukprot:gene10396-4116_t